MIDPTEADIGRAVVYRDGDYPGCKIQQGMISSFNEHYVFVRYSAFGSTAAATRREDLEWMHE